MHYKKPIFLSFPGKMLNVSGAQQGKDVFKGHLLFTILQDVI